MSDFISREALLDTLDETIDKCEKINTGRGVDLFYELRGEINATKAIRVMVKRFDTACVAPVVRCKDCYAYQKDKELARAAYLDEEMYCALLRCEMPPDGFCYYGKPNRDTKMEADDG